MSGLNIDFTLVVQAINFAIAYIAIRKLLLKPAFATIQENEVHERALSRKIETATLANGSREDRMHEQWRAYRVLVKEKVPVSDALAPAVLFTCLPKKSAEKMVDQEYAQYLVLTLTEGLVERMKHVRP